MASDRKNRAKKSKYATKSGEFRHSDGDRRRARRASCRPGHPRQRPPELQRRHPDR